MSGASHPECPGCGSDLLRAGIIGTRSTAISRHQPSLVSRLAGRSIVLPAMLLLAWASKCGFPRWSSFTGSPTYPRRRARSCGSSAWESSSGFMRHGSTRSTRFPILNLCSTRLPSRTQAINHRRIRSTNDVNEKGHGQSPVAFLSFVVRSATDQAALRNLLLG